MPSDRVDDLRQGAFGDDSRSAAIELLLHTHLVEESFPWVVHDRASDAWAIDFDVLVQATFAFPAEQQAWHLTPSRLAILGVAASLALDTPLRLRRLLPVLEYEHTELVMIAIAQAAGYTHLTADELPTWSAFPPLPPLAYWPDEPLPPDS